MAWDHAKLRQYVSTSFEQSLIHYLRIYAEPAIALCWLSVSLELCGAPSWLGLISSVNDLLAWAASKLAPKGPASICTFRKTTKRERGFRKSFRGVAIHAQFRHSNDGWPRRAFAVVQC